MSKYIGFIGSKGAGKSTAFFLLEKQHADVEEIMIAQRLKSVCSKVLCYPEVHFTSPTLKETPFPRPYLLTEWDLEFIQNSFDIPYCVHKKTVREHLGKTLHSPRHAAQYIGTEIIRSLDPQAHLRCSIRNITPDRIHIVTDIRFENEADYFKEMDKDFTLCYIKNDAAEALASKDFHSSEASLNRLKERADIVIDNNSTISELEIELKQLQPYLKREDS